MDSIAARRSASSAGWAVSAAARVGGAVHQLHGRRRMMQETHAPPHRPHGTGGDAAG
jgi:hypothetical protein